MNDSFHVFVNAIEGDSSLRQRLQSAPCLDTFLSEASQEGYMLSSRMLQLWPNHRILDQIGRPWVQQARMKIFMANDWIPGFEFMMM